MKTKTKLAVLAVALSCSVVGMAAATTFAWFGSRSSVTATFSTITVNAKTTKLTAIIYPLGSTIGGTTNSQLLSSESGSYATNFQLEEVTSDFGTNFVKKVGDEFLPVAQEDIPSYAAVAGIEDPFYKSFVTYARDFLSYISAEETRAPLDFFSWHIYTADPDDVAACAVYCRGMLDSHGFTSAESILDEWNYNVPDETGGKFRKSMKAAAFVAETLIRMQKLPVDAAMYYDAQVKLISYCGLFNEYTAKPEKPFYAMLAFDRVKQYGEPIATEDGDGLFTHASASDNGYALAVSNFNDSERTVTVRSDAAKFRVFSLDGEHDLEETGSYKEDVFTLTLKENTVVYLESEN